MNPPLMFDEYYYSHDCGNPCRRDETWLTFFDQIAKRIIEQFEPKTVLDAGCAWGFLVEAFRKHRVEAFGVDISEYAIQNIHPDIKPYCWMGSLTDPLFREYDLITCIEVLEHMPLREAETAIENLCSHTNVIVFSSTPFDYKEATHVNVHDPEYWAEQFARYGFYRDMEADMSFITAWAVSYVKEKRTNFKLVREYERKFWQLKKENSDLRQASFETQVKLRELENQIQVIGIQVANKEQTVKTLTAQAVEVENSKAWRLVTIIRKMHARLIPKNSQGECLSKKIRQGHNKK